MKAPECITLECEGYQGEVGNVMNMQDNGFMGLKETAL
jgi:hypothetical protein